MANLNVRLSATPELRPGVDRIRARWLNNLRDAVVALGASGYGGSNQHVYMDRNGVHVRGRPAPDAFIRFWAMVVSVDTVTGIAKCRKCAGELPYLAVEDPTSALIDVFVGDEGPVRASEGGSIADFVYCLPNPPEVRPDWFGLTWFRIGNFAAPAPEELSDLQYPPIT